MEPFGVILYFVIITGTGIAVTEKLDLSSSQKIPASFILGSVVLGVLLFLLCILQKINTTSITIVLALSTLLTIFQLKPLYRSFKDFLSDFNTYVLSEKRYKYLYVLIIILLIVWYISLSWTPPRAADAMRYHLAQLKDIVQNSGLVFRPYYCYNFPMYFTTLFLPVYYLLGGIGMKFAHCFYFISSVAIAVSLSFKLRIKNPILLISLFFLIPISFHEANQVYNDWVLIFYVLVGMFFLADRLELNDSFPVRIYIAFLSLGFALGVKYNAVLFIPWFFILAWNRLNNYSGNKIPHILGVLIIMSLCASPWYIRNMINTGNPCWPLLIDLFWSSHDYFYMIAKNTSGIFTGSYSLSSIITSLKAFIYYPIIPFTVWILCGIGFIYNKKTDLFIKTGIILFLITWWILQPKLYPRFSVYLLPFALIMITALHDRLNELKKTVKYAYYSLAGVTLIYGIVLGCFYSKDYFQYHLDSDLIKYHKTTWFYEEFDWMNNNLARDSKILVIVSAGQTYYLNLDYLRADPWLSGLIDWNNFSKISDLRKKLSQFDINYILYEDRSWDGTPGGSNMMKLITELKKDAKTKIEWEREAYLCSSRMKSIYLKTKIILMKN